MKRKKSGKEIRIEELRGVATFDTNELLAFVDAPVEQVAAAFQKLRKLKVWLRNARGKSITVTEPSYVVYRIKGHKWTIIDTYKGLGRYVDEKDALQLSKNLKTRTIFFGNSDTAGATGYDLFERGKRLEHFSCFEDVEFESEVRDIEPPEDGPEIYPFVEQFMKDQDAFAPGWTTYLGAICHKPGEKIKFDVLSDELVERLDYLSA